MGGCRCSYKSCTSVTTPDKAVHFFHYPVKAPDVCNQWIKNAEKSHFKQLSEDQLRNKVVCEYHFESKCFPNFQKKRLLRGAIPTLDGPAVTKQRSHSVMSRMPPLTPRLPPGTTARLSTPRQQGRNAEPPKIELLSANDDATLFVLETSGIEFSATPKTEMVESYIYENGSLLPSKDLENIDESVMELSEIDVRQQSEINQEQHKNVIAAMKTESRSEETYSFLYCENSTDEIEYPAAHKNVSPTPQNSIAYSKPVSSEHSSQILSGKSTSSEDLSKYKQKIKDNSRDIASIKQFIRNNMCIKRTFHNRFTLLRGIKRLVSPSLYSVLKMNLGSNKILSSDLQFFLSIYEKSPEVYNMLSMEYKWNLPDIRDLQAVMSDQTK